MEEKTITPILIDKESAIDLMDAAMLYSKSKSCLEPKAMLAIAEIIKQQMTIGNNINILIRLNDFDFNTIAQRFMKEDSNYIDIKG